MNQAPRNGNDLIFSYLSLRKVVGHLGVWLPLVLALGAMALFRDSVIRESMSHYYHSGMRDVFVGTLCVIGFFLFSYKGYERADNIAGNLACVFALGVAFFPTHPSPDEKSIIGTIHFVFAALLFLTLTYFSLILFTKTDPKESITTAKRQRNLVYKCCGYAMATCIVSIAGLALLPSEIQAPLEVNHQPVFWLEGIAIVAFGISWLTKGEAILRDR